MGAPEGSPAGRPPPPRLLDWEGCFNVRDLGGLRTLDRRRTLAGRVVRADSLDALTGAGWAALRAHGVRTIVDLREQDETGRRSEPPAGIVRVHVPLDGRGDRAFWTRWEEGPQFGTPLYFGPHLDRMPERSAAAVAAIARAGPGAVAFHCQGGRDRTGQVAMLVLALAGVDPQQIAADYALSEERVMLRNAALGRAEEGAELRACLDAAGTTAEQAVIDTLAAIDVESLLLAAGLRRTDVAALRRRLLEP